jgi:hypothetical protein
MNFIPFRLKVISVIFANSVRVSERTQSVYITKTNKLMRLRNIISVYCGNREKYINVLCGQNSVRATGTFILY